VSGTGTSVCPEGHSDSFSCGLPRHVPTPVSTRARQGLQHVLVGAYNVDVREAARDHDQEASRGLASGSTARSHPGRHHDLTPEATPLTPSRADQQAAFVTVAIGIFGAATCSTESSMQSVSARWRTRVDRRQQDVHQNGRPVCHRNVTANAALMWLGTGHVPAPDSGARATRRSRSGPRTRPECRVAHAPSPTLHLQWQPRTGGTERRPRRGRAAPTIAYDRRTSRARVSVGTRIDTRAIVHGVVGKGGRSRIGWCSPSSAPLRTVFRVS
jgi:hypothetical protein